MSEPLVEHHFNQGNYLRCVESGKLWQVNRIENYGGDCELYELISPSDGGKRFVSGSAITTQYTPMFKTDIKGVEPGPIKQVGQSAPSRNDI